MDLDYRKTMFFITLSSRADRLYAFTMTNGSFVMAKEDDNLEANIVDLFQGILGYFEDHGAVGDELMNLLTSNVKLCFPLEDMIPHDPTLKELVECGGFTSRTFYPNGIWLKGLITYGRSVIKSMREQKFDST